MARAPATPASRITATVLIKSEEPIEDLRKTLASCEKLPSKPEVVVARLHEADAAKDLLRRDFPRVHLVTALRDGTRPGGLLELVNEAARTIKSPILIVLSDRATFSSPDTPDQVISDFNHPRVAAIAIPVIEAPDAPRLAGPSSAQIMALPMFRADAYALRLDVFRSLAGHWDELGNQSEEADYAIRLLDAGFVTRAGRCDPVTLRASPLRTTRAAWKRASRNSMLFAWRHVPPGHVMTHVVRTALVVLRSSLRRSRFGPAFAGILAGLSWNLRNRRERTPVSLKAYKLFNELSRRGPLPLEEIEARLGTFKSV